MGVGAGGVDKGFFEGGLDAVRDRRRGEDPAFVG